MSAIIGRFFETERDKSRYGSQVLAVSQQQVSLIPAALPLSFAPGWSPHTS